MRRRRAIKFCAVFVLAASAAGAHAQQSAPPMPLNPDLLTVSGRDQLPSGRQSDLEERLRIAEIRLAPLAGKPFGVSDEALRASLQAALDKSLTNHRYRSTPTSERVLDLKVELQPFDPVVDTLGATAALKMHFTVVGNQTTACFPYDAKGEYHALMRARSGDGRRAFSIATSVGLAFLGVGGGQLITNQFGTAAAENRLLNDKRTTGANEGVADTFGPDGATTHAAVKATHAAIMDLLVHMGDRNGCNSARPKPDPVAAQETTTAAISSAAAPIAGVAQ